MGKCANLGLLGKNVMPPPQISLPSP